MNLNNKGWGLQTMMIFVLILMICLVAIAAMINNTFKDVTGNSSYNYAILEDKLKDASKKYIEKNNISINEGNNYTITVNKLQKAGYLKEYRFRGTFSNPIPEFCGSARGRFGGIYKPHRQYARHPPRSPLN